MAAHEEFSGLPTDEELSQLRPVECVALSARCALRALPLVTDFGRRGHRVEGAVRAVQCIVAACTAQTKIQEASYAITSAGRNSTNDLVSSHGNLVLMHAAGAASYFARFRQSKEVFIKTIETFEAYVTAAKKAGASSSEAVQAIRLDFNTARTLSKSPAAQTPVSFFAAPLWPADERTFWAERQVGWHQTFPESRFNWEIETYFRLAEGKFDPEIEADSFNSWVSQQKTTAGLSASEAIDSTESQQARRDTAARPDEPVDSQPDTLPLERPRTTTPAPSGEVDEKPNEKSQSTRENAPRPRRTVETRLENDSTSGTDTLNRTRLARVIAAFLLDERTQTPLTLSIEGRWGTGKTKFMKLLQSELDPPNGALESKRRVRTVWFNPWRHQSHEELWAAFALTVLSGMRQHLSWRQRAKADLKLSWACLDRRSFWQSAATAFTKVAAFGVLLVFFIAFADAGWKPDELLAKIWTVQFWKEFVGIPVAVSAPAIMIGQTVLWLWKGYGAHLRHDLELHIERPNYAARTTFLAEFHRDFARAVTIYTGGQPVAVFIDDLDRCDIPRAAELIQGINLMIGEDVPLIYVLGIDRAKIAAGIAVRHSELLPFLYARELALSEIGQQAHELHTCGLEYGYEFIEKFIQLPFRIPPSEHAELKAFIHSRLTQPPEAPQANASSVPVSRLQRKAEDSAAREKPERTGEETISAPLRAEQAEGMRPDKPEPPAAPELVLGDESYLEEPLLHAAQVLDGNPRRIAQLINLVRLQQRLAPVLGVQVADGQLAKWTAVALRWPVFLIELEQERDLLENLVQEANPAGQSERYRRWNSETQLVKCLRDRGPHGANAADYDLIQPGAVDALLRLGIAVPIAETGAGVSPMTARLAERLESKPMNQS